MLKNKSNFVIILAITFVAAALRFYKLSDFPVSLNWDEVSHGYNAFSILKTGKDEWGITLPLIFRAFGDYKLPVYIYLTIVPILIFGLNAFAVRFVSALAGALAIPGIYLLANALFPGRKTRIFNLEVNLGHLSSFILAVIPWHVFISRPALEANLSLTLIIYGAFFLYTGIRKPNNFIPASILLGLSLHTYNTARVFVPLLILLFAILFWKHIALAKSLIFSSVIFASFMLIVVFQVISGTGTARYGKLKILSENAVFQIGQNRQNSKLPVPLPTLIYNRPVYFTLQVAKNYLSYFTPQFLYQSEGVQTQFAIPIKNLFTLPVILLLLVGVFYLFFIVSSRSGFLIFFWLLLSPLAASFTVDPPQALRPNPFIPSVAIIAAIGILLLLEKTRPMIRNIILVTMIFSLSLALSRYLNTYFGEYAHYYSDSWQFGYKDVVEYLKTSTVSYDKIIFTKKYGEPHIFYAFFNQLNPTILQPGGDNIRFAKSGWYWTDKIDKVFFVNDWDIPYRGELIGKITLESGEEIDSRNSLLVTTFNRVPDNAKIEKVIEFVDGRVAFIIASIP